MRHARWMIGSLFLITLLASAANGQESYRFHVSPYAGIFLFDDQALQDDTGFEVNTAVILGARLGYAFARSWQVEGGYGYASLTSEPSSFQSGLDEQTAVDMEAHLLYGAIDYLLTYANNPTALLLTAGGGVMILSPDSGDHATDPMIELGTGFTHPVSDRVTVRGDARDHIVFCSQPDFSFEFGACPGGDKTLHNFEVSAAIQFWLH